MLCVRVCTPGRCALMNMPTPGTTQHNSSTTQDRHNTGTRQAQQFYSMIYRERGDGGEGQEQGLEHEDAHAVLHGGDAHGPDAEVEGAQQHCGFCVCVLCVCGL